MNKLSVLFGLCIVLASFYAMDASAAHFIVGKVNDTAGGISPDGLTVAVYVQGSPTDNITDIVGPSGNSWSSNYYLVDCELLSTACQVGDTIVAEVLMNASGFVAGPVSRSVTGAGFDVMPQMVLSGAPDVKNVFFDDAITSPSDRINLVAGGTRLVNCSGNVSDSADYTNIDNVTGVIYYSEGGTGPGDPDDNNTHYTNSSCAFYTCAGASCMTYCEFDMQYYATNGTWTCNLTATNTNNVKGYGADTNAVQTLVAMNISSTINFGKVNALNVSNQNQTNISNVGNVEIDFRIKAYAWNDADGIAMNCTQGSNRTISYGYEGYNITSTPGGLTYSQFDNSYTKVSIGFVALDANLSQRQNDDDDDAQLASYWRVYVPPGVAGTCNGTVQITAAFSPP